MISTISSSREYIFLCKSNIILQYFMNLLWYFDKCEWTGRLSPTLYFCYLVWIKSICITIWHLFNLFIKAILLHCQGICCGCPEFDYNRILFREPGGLFKLHSVVINDVRQMQSNCTLSDYQVHVHITYRYTENPTRRQLLKEQDQLNVTMHHATFQALNHSSANRSNRFFLRCSKQGGIMGCAGAMYLFALVLENL